MCTNILITKNSVALKMKKIATAARQVMYPYLIYLQSLTISDFNNISQKQNPMPLQASVMYTNMLLYYKWMYFGGFFLRDKWKLLTVYGSAYAPYVDQEVFFLKSTIISRNIQRYEIWQIFHFDSVIFNSKIWPKLERKCMLIVVYLKSFR